jgi:hypothetical protein
MAYLRIVLACVAGMTISGCATPALHKFASQEEVRDHRVAEVISASRGEDGAILICTTGWPAKRDRDTSPVAFSISFPLSLFESGSDAPPILHGDAESIASYRLVAERMGEPCPKDPADAGAIRIRRVDREYFGGDPVDMASRATIAPFLDEEDPEALLYVLGAGDPTRSPLVVYQHTEPVFRGSRLVSITMPSETVKPNNAAYIAMPLALAADVALGLVFVVALALGAVATAN